jgi:fatty-acyl-CoA synthase
VIALPDERWIEAITAVVVAKGAVTPQELIAHVKGKLAGFKVPKQVHLVDELPRNASGKLLKRVLRDELTGQ